MLIPMVDTLCAIVDIENYGNSDSMIKLLNRLEVDKQKAKAVKAVNMNQKHLIELGGQTFEILQNGAKGYAYILHNEAYEIRLAQYRSNSEDFYPIFIRLKSEFLWSYGVSDSWYKLVGWINENIGEIKANKVNRIDLCCHTDDIELDDSDSATFQGTYHDDVIHRHRRKVNAMCFGSRSSRKVYCRIYDKTLEVKKGMTKMWFFDVWQKAGLNPEKVWNVEFEINREFLKELKIESVEDALKQLRSIWEYCTKEWIVKKNLDRTRIENCTTNENWIKIQNAFIRYRGIGLISRQKQLSTSAFALLPGTIGNLTSYAARAEITDIDKILEVLKSQGARYLHKKDTDYEEVIADKMSLLG